MKPKLDGVVEWLIDRLSSFLPEKIVNIPGKTYDGYTFYLTPGDLTEYINSYEFNDKTLEALNRAMSFANSYLMVDLTPIIVYNTLNGTLSVTSEERLKGEFIQ